MKKLFALLLAVLLVFTGAVSYFLQRDKSVPADEPETPAPVEQAAEAETEAGAEDISITYQRLDLDALYALHEPDEIVATVRGRDVTWDEYFYWLAAGSASVENYMVQMAIYGGGVSWEDPWGDDPDEDFFGYVLNSAEENIKPFLAIEALASENGVTLNEEEQAQVAERMASYRAESVGEDASDEEFVAYLRETERMSLSTLERLMTDSALYQACFRELYGKDGEKLSDEEVMAYLAEQGYLRANHILRLTKDMDTGEDLDEATVAEKQAEAAAIAAQLQAIEDPEELLKKLQELKTEWDEDSGKEAYPDGYVFVEGQMVDEFYEGTKALEEYRVSDPVQSEYGYHVIVRLPLDPDTVLGTSAEGTPLTARASCANARYGELLDERLAETAFVYAPGFEKPELSAFLIEDTLG